MRVADLVAGKAPYNPRVIAPEQYEALLKSIQRFGVVEPVVWNKRTGRVVGGHQRVDAMEALGIEDAPVVLIDVSENEEIALNLALNKISGVFDDAKLQALLGNLDGDLKALTGFTDQETAALAKLGSLSLYQYEQAKTQAREFVRRDLADPRHSTVDDLGPIEAKFEARVALGDMWKLGEHRLLCGDSGNELSAAVLFEGQPKARLLATDPPYGVSLSSVKDGIPRPGFSKMLEEHPDLDNDTLDGPQLQAFLESVFRAALPYLDRAAWYLWHAHLTQGFFAAAAAAAAAAADVLLHRQIIWKKPGFVLTRSGMWHWAHEPCFFGWVRGQKPDWFEDQSQTSVWECGRDESAGFHQTQKPVELFCKPMRAHTHEGDVCYEPFCGSGSQIIAGEMLKRRVLACELSPHFCDGILDRWERFVGNGAKAERIGTVGSPAKA